MINIGWGWVGRRRKRQISLPDYQMFPPLPGNPFQDTLTTQSEGFFRWRSSYLGTFCSIGSETESEGILELGNVPRSSQIPSEISHQRSYRYWLILRTSLWWNFAHCPHPRYMAFHRCLCKSERQEPSSRHSAGVLLSFILKSLDIALSWQGYRQLVFSNQQWCL